MKKISMLIASLFLLGIIFHGCEEAQKVVEKIDALSDVLGEDGEATDLFGWIGSDEENLDEIEDDINLGSMGDQDLPSSVDLTSKLPPIGNQGAYGTCVAWALGYNLKTFLEGVDQGYSPSQLSNVSNQFSPKDLFWSIPSAQKGADCNGTGFEYAFDMMVSRGIAKMSTVPYSGLGDCSNSPESEWTSDAGNYKIDSYREVNLDVDELKGYLADGRAVAIGARLGDNFMAWNSDDVINSDTYLNPGMQHAYHAMLLAGYDDDMGSSGAFRVVNSWATSWGDDGYIWVDYDFFVDEFCFAAFVATNKRSNPDDDGDNVVDPDETTSGKDLVAWELQDYDDYDDSDPLYRTIEYNVFNAGTSTIPATDRWNIIYIYYNAYDANDFGIVLYDYYTDEYGNSGNYWANYEGGEQLGNNGSFNVISEIGDGSSGNWWNNCDVAPGISVANALYNTTDTFGFTWGYKMENVTGYYYMVLIADGYDVISEAYEDNNYYFYTDDYGDPLYVDAGIINDSGSKKSANNYSKPGKFAASPKGTVKAGRNMNAYSSQEIREMLKYHKRSGLLQQKVDEYLLKNGRQQQPKR
ncbi:MAG: C1 family peptidase [Bacteroidales bacterium]|nr:C1 family peptidase [Bacteroidales bacterium]